MAEEQEIWKDVVGYEGLYQVSNLGRVKSLDRYVVYHYNNGKGDVTVFRKGRIMRQFLYKTGYLYTCLAKEGIRIKYKIHRLVAMAFLPNPENKPVVNHKDGCTTNNNLNNIEWATLSENVQHAIWNGLLKTGTDSFWSKLTNEQVDFIRKNYEKRGKYNFVTLGKMFNVTPRTIQNVIQRNTYYVVK